MVVEETNGLWNPSGEEGNKKIERVPSLIVRPPILCTFLLSTKFEKTITIRGSFSFVFVVVVVVVWCVVV